MPLMKLQKYTNMKTDYIEYNYGVYFSCCNHSFYNNQRHIRIVLIPTNAYCFNKNDPFFDNLKFPHTILMNACMSVLV